MWKIRSERWPWQCPPQWSWWCYSWGWIFCTGTLWPDVGVLEPLGESLIMNGAISIPCSNHPLPRGGVGRKGFGRRSLSKCVALVSGHCYEKRWVLLKDVEKEDWRRKVCRRRGMNTWTLERKMRKYNKESDKWRIFIDKKKEYERLPVENLT